MPWSRVDSGFWRHPKFQGWTAAQKWALGELMGYCCEYRTDGHIPDDLSLLPRSITKTFLALAADAGWLDLEDGGYRFHDWNDYHPADPTAADRMKRHRRNKTRNGSVTEPVTTNTNTITNKKNQRPLGGNDEPRPLRAVEEAPDGPVERPGEDHGSGHDPAGVEPDAGLEAEVLRVRAVIQEQLAQG